MIPVTPLMREACHYSQTMSLTVDIMRGGAVVAPDVPVLGGKFDSDRGSKARMSASVQVGLANHPELSINQNLHRFRVRRGYQSLGIKAEIQHGYFRIDDLEINDDGSANLEGSGLESYIIDGRFLRPRTPPRGVSTVGHITTLIQEILPGQRVSVECSRDKPVQATAPWERERWDAIESLASSINAEVYADYRGYFVIRDKPSLTAATTPVYIIEEGKGGTLNLRKEKSSRATVYNAASVSGQSSDPNVIPAWGWAYDNDPTSPTYFYGDFGQVPVFYSSQFFTNNGQCENYAIELLAESLARNQSLSIDILPLTFLEPGDVLSIQLKSGERQRRMIDKIAFNLGINPGVSIDTLFMGVL